MESLDVESDKSSGDGGGNLKFIIGCLLCLVVCIAVVLAVILTLPHTLTCFPHDARFFVDLTPNATITKVTPSMVCVAQRNETVRIDGAHFLKYNVDDDDLEEGGEAR